MKDGKIFMTITIGLDRDGTINQEIGTYVIRPAQFIPIPGSIEAIVMLRSKGYNVVIITNQNVISKGLATSADIDAVHDYMLELLGKAGCSNINGVYYSTSSSNDDEYAKPNVGMFKRAEQEQRLKFKGGAYVGDKVTDLRAAVRMHALPIMVKTGHGLDELAKLDTFDNRDLKTRTRIFENLWDFANSLPDLND